MENTLKYYWNSVNRGYTAYPTLSSNEKCDVVIVGGGISGCLTAYYLSAYNLNTILLEKNFIAQGNASTSIGILESTSDIDTHELSRIIGRKNAMHADKLCEKAIDDIEYILYNINFSHTFEKKDILYYKIKEDAKNIFIKDSESHSYSKYCGLIDPFKFCHGLLKAAQKKSARIYESTAAIGYDSYTNNLRIHTSTSHYIDCKKIVFTNGLSVYNILSLNDLIKIKDIHTIVTNPLEDNFLNVFNKSFVITDNEEHTYVRKTNDKRVILSRFGSNHMVRIEDKLLGLLRTLYDYPQELKVDFSFSNPYGSSSDGLPYIGAHPKLENCYLNLAFGRNHVCYSLIGAQIIKDLILYNTSPNAELFSFER